MPTLSSSLSYISEWFNRHKSILVLIGMPLGAGFAYAYDNVVLAQEYQAHIKSQNEINETFAKSISVLDYQTRLDKVQEDIEFLLDDRLRNELDARELRRLERLEREEVRLEQLILNP